MKNNDRFRFRVWNKANNYYIDEYAVSGLNLRDLPLTEKYYITEQCTGLKDNKGKLIYEGDIVEIIDNEQENAFVYFDEHTAQFVVRTKDVDFDFDNISNEELEVIGNIHENPELLER